MLKAPLLISLLWFSILDTEAFAKIGMQGPTTAQVSVCFVPNGSCSDEIVDTIAAAKKSILVQAYELTAPPILQALVKAHLKGVDVRAILDYSEVQKNSSGAVKLSKAGIPVWIDHPVHIAHNKIMIIDNTLVVGGSYNYTKDIDTMNIENVTFLASPEVAGWYVRNWMNRQAASKPFIPGF